MAASKSTPAATRRDVQTVTPIDGDGFSAVERALIACRQTLMCATIALGEAEDQGFEDDTGPAAIRVVERCSEDLSRIENELDAWYVTHEHTPRKARP